MATIHIELVYALPSDQTLIGFSVNVGTSVRQAIVESGIQQRYPDINFLELPVGIFGKRITDPANHILQANDRIEIYRALQVDPKEIRKRRAQLAADKNKA